MRRPYVGPVLTRGHIQARLQRCHTHRRWLVHQWYQVLFSDESRFTLEKADGRVPVYQHVGDAIQMLVLGKLIVFVGGQLWFGAD